MSAGFRAVQWNRAKLVYDAILLAGVALYRHLSDPGVPARPAQGPAGGDRHPHPRLPSSTMVR